MSYTVLVIELAKDAAGIRHFGIWGQARLAVSYVFISA